MRSISVKVPEALAEEVKDKLHGSRYNDRSELIRDLLRQWVERQRIAVSTQ